MKLPTVRRSDAWAQAMVQLALVEVGVFGHVNLSLPLAAFAYRQRDWIVGDVGHVVDEDAVVACTASIVAGSLGSCRCCRVSCPRIAHEPVKIDRHGSTPPDTKNREPPDQSIQIGTGRHQPDGAGRFVIMRWRVRSSHPAQANVLLLLTPLGGASVVW